MSWSVTLSASKAETGKQNKRSHIHVRNKERWYFPMINPQPGQAGRRAAVIPIYRGIED
jgi:hypothetical protein